MTVSHSEFGEVLSSPASQGESEYHRLLASERRRTLLDILNEQPSTVDLDTVAMAVMEEEAEPTETVRSVAIALHHKHLPRLSHAGVVDYDPESNLIRT